MGFNESPNLPVNEAILIYNEVIALQIQINFFRHFSETFASPISFNLAVSRSARVNDGKKESNVNLFHYITLSDIKQGRLVLLYFPGIWNYSSPN